MRARTDPKEDLPDTCESGGCEKRPEYRHKYVKPLDYVYYCADHSWEHRMDDNFKKATAL